MAGTQPRVYANFICLFNDFFTGPDMIAVLGESRNRRILACQLGTERMIGRQRAKRCAE